VKRILFPCLFSILVMAPAFAGSGTSVGEAAPIALAAPISPLVATRPAVSAESQPYRSLSPMGKLARFGRSAYSPRVFAAGVLTAGMPNLPDRPQPPSDLPANPTRAQILAYNKAEQAYEKNSLAYQDNVQEEVRLRMRGFVSGVAEAETRNFLGEFLLPVAFRQDPRYVPSTGAHSGGYRLLYAMSRVVVGHSDSGHTMFNFSKVGASVGSAAAARYYYDSALNLPRLQTNTHMAKTIGANLALDVLLNIWHEFHGSRAAR
jgi:hypothetical protein